jgi:hypothetical protein
MIPRREKLKVSNFGEDLSYAKTTLKRRIQL